MGILWNKHFLRHRGTFDSYNPSLCNDDYHTVLPYCVYRDGPGVASIIVYLRKF